MSDAYIGANKEYRAAELDRSCLDPDPFTQLKKWIEEAGKAGVAEPTAFCFATCGHDGRPSNRFLLVRKIDENGLIFFTNYESRKGQELCLHPFASACAWWQELERQVRIEGSVERVTGAESDAYFASRPYESRLASAASPQSQVLESRAELETKLHTLRSMYGEEIPRPASWGGYRLIPHRFEFWQGRPARLHDRFEYVLEEEGWGIRRLAP